MNSDREKIYEEIGNWTRSIFMLPANTSILISENQRENSCIEPTITIHVKNSIYRSYNILKSAPEIIIEDVEYLKNSAMETALKNHPFLGRLFRFFGWWFIFAGALSAMSVCPVCGQVGCPVGVGTTGILAGFFALIKQNGKESVKFIKQKIWGIIINVKNKS